MRVPEALSDAVACHRGGAGGALSSTIVSASLVAASYGGVSFVGSVLAPRLLDKRTCAWYDGRTNKLDALKLIRLYDHCVPFMLLHKGAKDDATTTSAFLSKPIMKMPSASAARSVRTPVLLPSFVESDLAANSPTKTFGSDLL